LLELRHPIATTFKYDLLRVTDKVR